MSVFTSNFRICFSTGRQSELNHIFYFNITVLYFLVLFIFNFSVFFSNCLVAFLFVLANLFSHLLIFYGHELHFNVIKLNFYAKSVIYHVISLFSISLPFNLLKYYRIHLIFFRNVLLSICFKELNLSNHYFSSFNHLTKSLNL